MALVLSEECVTLKSTLEREPKGVEEVAGIEFMRMAEAGTKDSAQGGTIGLLTSELCSAQDPCTNELPLYIQPWWRKSTHLVARTTCPGHQAIGIPTCVSVLVTTK